MTISNRVLPARVAARLTERAASADITWDEIHEWARGTGDNQGQLPKPSAHAFATWLHGCWDDWTEDEDATVLAVLLGAVADWCGGRSF